MVKLISYEYRKNFKKISIVIVTLLLSIVSVMKINSLYHESSFLARGMDAKGIAISRQFYWKMYKKFSGTITEQKIENLMAIYNPVAAKTADHTASRSTHYPGTYTGNMYADCNLLESGFMNPMEYFYQYQGYANQITNAALGNMSFYQSAGNSFEYRKNADIAEIYSGRKIGSFTYTNMFQQYFQYDFSSILVLMICLYGLIGVFVSDKETDMDTLLLTTRLGGRKTVTAKILASALFICLVSFWFWLLDFLAFACTYGSVTGACAPLYAIEDFSDAAINLNFWQYAVVSAIVKTIGMLVLGLGILLISSFFKNALLPFSLSLALSLCLVYFQAMATSSGHIFLKSLNPFILMANREIFRNTEFADLFSFPVPSYVIALLFAALYGILFLLGIAFSVRKNTITRKGKL